MPQGLAAFLDALSRAVHVASDLVWGPFTMALLLGSGLFLTPRYRFVQVTRFREAVAKSLVRSAGSAQGRSSRTLWGCSGCRGWLLECFAPTEATEAQRHRELREQG